MSTDAELIDALRRGDLGAVAALHHRHVRAATATAQALLHDASEAGAIANEVFARVIAAIEAGGGPESAFRSYLTRAVHNECVDEARSRRDTPSRVADVATSLWAETDLDGRLLDGWHAGARRASVDPAVTVFASMDGALARLALEMLSDRSRQILELMEVDGCDLAEAAALMGIEPGAAAALRYRAKEKLRQAYLVASAPVPDNPACLECVTRLGAVVRGEASRRHRAKVVEHLTRCRACRAVEADIRDLNAEIDRGRA